MTQTHHSSRRPLLPRHPPSRGTWLALLFVLLWASAFPAARFVFADCPPLLFLCARFLVAGALLSLWAWRRGELAGLRWRDGAALALLALLNHALYLGLSWTGMLNLSAGLASIIIGANPIAVAVLSAWLLREKLTRNKLAGLLLGFAGMAWVVHSRVSSGSDVATGLPLVFAALLSLAAGTVLYKRLPVATGLAGNAGLQILLAGILLAPVALLLESPAAIRFTPALLGAFTWLTLLVSIGAYLLWFHLLQSGDATSVSAWLFLTPPLGLAAGSLLLGEIVGAGDFIGVLPVVLGIMLVTHDGAAKPSHAAARTSSA